MDLEDAIYYCSILGCAPEAAESMPPEMFRRIALSVGVVGLGQGDDDAQVCRAMVMEYSSMLCGSDPRSDNLLTGLGANLAGGDDGGVQSNLQKLRDVLSNIVPLPVDEGRTQMVWQGSPGPRRDVVSVLGASAMNTHATGTAFSEMLEGGGLSLMDGTSEDISPAKLRSERERFIVGDDNTLLMKIVSDRMEKTGAKEPELSKEMTYAIHGATVGGEGRGYLVRSKHQESVSDEYLRTCIPVPIAGENTDTLMDSIKFNPPAIYSHPIRGGKQLCYGVQSLWGFVTKSVEDMVLPEFKDADLNKKVMEAAKLGRVSFPMPNPPPPGLRPEDLRASEQDLQLLHNAVKSYQKLKADVYDVIRREQAALENMHGRSYAVMHPGETAMAVASAAKRMYPHMTDRMRGGYIRGFATRMYNATMAFKDPSMSTTSLLWSGATTAASMGTWLVQNKLMAVLARTFSCVIAQMATLAFTIGPQVLISPYSWGAVTLRTLIPALFGYGIAQLLAIAVSYLGMGIRGLASVIESIADKTGSPKLRSMAMFLSKVIVIGGGVVSVIALFWLAPFLFPSILGAPMAIMNVLLMFNRGITAGGSWVAGKVTSTVGLGKVASVVSNAPSSIFGKVVDGASYLIPTFASNTVSYTTKAFSDVKSAVSSAPAGIMQHLHDLIKDFIGVDIMSTIVSFLKKVGVTSASVKSGTMEFGWSFIQENALLIAGSIWEYLANLVCGPEADRGTACKMLAKFFPMFVHAERAIKFLWYFFKDFIMIAITAVLRLGGKFLGDGMLSTLFQGSLSIFGSSCVIGDAVAPSTIATGLVGGKHGTAYFTEAIGATQPMSAIK